MLLILSVLPLNFSGISLSFFLFLPLSLYLTQVTLLFLYHSLSHYHCSLALTLGLVCLLTHFSSLFLSSFLTFSAFLLPRLPCCVCRIELCTKSLEIEKSFIRKAMCWVLSLWNDLFCSPPIENLIDYIFWCVFLLTFTADINNKICCNNWACWFSGLQSCLGIWGSMISYGTFCSKVWELLVEKMTQSFVRTCYLVKRRVASASKMSHSVSFTLKHNTYWAISARRLQRSYTNS